jgi:hypothetical protein
VPVAQIAGQRRCVQEGEVTVHDGGETQVQYPKPFEAPPRLAIVEFRQSSFKDQPYSKSDFRIEKQDATGFKISTSHSEQAYGSWATLKWRAEGLRTKEQSGATRVEPYRPGQANRPTREQILAWIQKAGGTVTFDSSAPNHPIVGVDLHKTKITDADLEVLQGLTSLRTLNLYGTRISDAGLRNLSGLTGLQTLFLNNTSVTDAGLKALEGLAGLRELDLNQTAVTDRGLPQLKSLTNLNKLVVSGSKITDFGLMQLNGMKNLRELVLVQTGVTAGGLQDFKDAMPHTHVFQ